MTTATPQPKMKISGAVARAILPWCLLFAAAKPLLSLGWPPPEWSTVFLQWLWFAVDDTSFVLPFAAFAGGVALKSTLGYSRRAFRAAVAVGVVTSSVSYSLGAWVAPTIEHSDLARFGAATADVRKFGPRTPVGVLRNLRSVEANPPDEYSLQAGAPERIPPNILRWELYLPASLAVFGLINVLLGVLAAELTVDLKRGQRRNALLAMGILGGAAFHVLQLLGAPTEPFLQSGSLRSGIAAAWAPLLLPFVESLLLVYLIRDRRYG